MANITPYPPHRTLTSTPLTPSAALSNLSAYLDLSTSTPYLHPDAYITPEEIKYSTTGGPTGNIALHNLRRISAGLGGEVLAPEPSSLFPSSTTDAEAEEMVGAARLGEKKPLKSALKKRKAEEEEEGQSMESWRLQQDEIIGEVGDRGVEGGEVVDEEEAEVQMLGNLRDVDDSEQLAGKMDKEARKRAKKAKRKSELRERHEAKAQA